ncbi:eukaryotic translation initiation factor 4B [Daktulosphaira vitifoliae]|uniref:eukaryotic translation initiation factor 4B n=1 Tax=Daktulosphaira vitifoliae TaxID=58002 RepID=UPI0021AA9A11|nr:eukaryotic translation initiation factor 4B [Daktulosphaira vitifoliae]
MSNKKSKKQKWKPIETEVISIASGTCWADEVEKEQNGFSSFGFEAKPLNLPKAPRAACETLIDESTVPQEGPFMVHMSNLQFEIDEDDITNYFKGLKVENIKLPRNDNGRNKGFGYVEFEERKDLIIALGMENLIRGRRVRVELASGAQDSRNAFQRGSNRMGMDFKSDSPSDWRIRNSTTSDDRGGFTRRRDGGAFDKDHDSERDSGPWARGSRRNYDDDAPSGRRPFSDRRTDDFDGNRRPFGDRRHDDFEGGRRPFNDRRDDSERKPFGESRRGFGFKREDDLPEISTSPPRERPKLILKPKTVDSNATTKTDDSNYIAPPSIFGGAKPVDTAAKEREIEEKLLAKHEPKIQLSAASSVNSLNDPSDEQHQEETEVKPPSHSRPVETWRRRSPRRQNDDRPPRRRTSPDKNPHYEEASLPKENLRDKSNQQKSDENECNGLSISIDENSSKPNVYIPPNLRKQAVKEQSLPDRAADGSEIIETAVIETPNDIRTDPDGQSSESDLVKDQSSENDKNDSGFIECGKNGLDKNKFKKQKTKVVKKMSETDMKKKDPIVSKEQKKSTSNKFAALLDDGSNE